MVVRKYINVMAFFAVAIISLNTCDIFTNDSYNAHCYCEYKAHLGMGEICDCGYKSSCKCTEEIAYLEGIPIRKDANYKLPLMYYAVTSLNAAANQIISAYMWLDTDEMAVFKSKVKEIHVILGNEKHIVLKGTILEVGASASDFEIYMGIRNWVLLD